jgi:hypothetical protein
VFVIAINLVPTQVAVNPPQTTPVGEVPVADDLPNGGVLGFLIVKLEPVYTRVQHLVLLLLPNTVSLSITPIQTLETP